MNGSASSVEFTSIGSSKLYFNGTWENADNAVYFTVYINGARQTKRLKFETGSSSQLIANGLESTETYTIKIVRETEEKYGNFTARSVSMEYHGKLGAKPADKKLHIEFIGDSVTCGLGSLCGYLAEDGVTVSDKQTGKCGVTTAETALCEDATNSYAYLAAQTLNADCSVVSKSGLGITETWGNEPALEYYNKQYNKNISPDLVVINLGTNDWGTSADITSFKNGVKALINKVRELRGANVKIIWTTGLMGNAYKEYTAIAINELGYDNVYHFTGLTEGRGGHNGHPTKEQAAVAAKELVNFIVDNSILADKETALADSLYAPMGYNLVWYDSFSAPALDKAKWVHINSAEENDDTNRTPGESDFAISDDNAVLSIIKQGSENKNVILENLTTKNRMAFKYGYLEMRARVPYGNPMWPSFWLQSNRTIEKTLTEYMTEVDIFEVFGNKKATPNIHKWINGRSIQANNTSNGPLYKKSYTFTKDLATLNSEYHIYGFLVDETEMSFFIDGEKYATISADDIYWGEGSKGINDYFYVILSLGFWHNSQNGENSTSFPANYCVDYVRLYQNSNGSIFFGQLPK